MAEPAPGEKEVQILRPEAGNHLKLDISSLERILLANGVKDKPVVVVSVAGAYRKGKSFLLGFFLRYMRSDNKTNWLQDSNAPLKGFTWSGGSKRRTMGMLLWSRVFLVNTPNHGKVAVIFVDSQGLFDRRNTLEDCGFIFALSTLISSVQLYHISHSLEIYHLHNFEFFAEYGRLAQSAGIKGKLFQKLLFLVRDWFDQYTKPYGARGGGQYLDEFLEEERGNREVQTFQEVTRPLFTDVGCFLMPHPGLKVCSESFNGCVSDMQVDFSMHLRNLVPSLLAPENLLVKEINGKTITCQQLVEYIKAYVGVFNAGTTPCPTTVLEATYKVTIPEVVNDALQQYKHAMNRLYHGQQLLYASWMEIEMDHYWFRDWALKAFDRWTSSYREAFAKQCRDRLKQEIREFFEEMSTLKLTAMGGQDQQQVATTIGNAFGSLLLSPIPVVGSLFDQGKACVDEITEQAKTDMAETRAFERRLCRAKIRDELGD